MGIIYFEPESIILNNCF